VPDGKVFSLISSLPSSLSADEPSVFVRMIHRYYAAVRLLADVHAGRVAWAFSRRPAAKVRRRHLRGLPVLVHEVSRRAWGLRLRRTEQRLALSPPFMLPSAHVNRVGVRVVCFRSSIAHPAYTPVYASLGPSRLAAQDSGPSRSLVLSRKNFAFSASCRFIPAHKHPHFTNYPQTGVVSVIA
jgi:hypothetical protein